MINISLVIAEDEIRIRRGITASLNFEEMGIRVAGEASRGDEALHLIQTLKPKILLLDICMPGMTGIEVLESLETNEMPMRTIILTGHDEFDYARGALNQGAWRYLLKPCSKSVLQETLKEARRDIVDQSASVAADESMRDHLPDLSVQSNREQNPGRVCCILFQPLSPKASIVTLAESIMNIPAGSASGSLHGGLDSVFWIIPEDDAEHARTAIETLKSQDSIPCRITMGPPASHPGDAAAGAWDEFLHLFYKDGDSRPAWGPPPDEEIIRKLRRDVVIKGKAAAHDAVKTLLKHAALKYTHPNRLKQCLEQILESHSGISTSHTVHHRQLAWAASMERMSIVCHEFIEAHSWTIPDSTERLIRQALECIDSCYMENIGLETVARNLGISPQHLSTTFKRVTGSTFHSTLSERRIQSAKTLLETTHLRISEVAAQTGFFSGRNFQHAFKKATSLTPSEFRNQSGLH